MQAGSFKYSILEILFHLLTNLMSWIAQRLSLFFPHIFRELTSKIINSPFFIPIATISPSGLQHTVRAACPKFTLFNIFCIRSKAITENYIVQYLDIKPAAPPIQFSIKSSLGTSNLRVPLFFFESTISLKINCTYFISDIPQSHCPIFCSRKEKIPGRMCCQPPNRSICVTTNQNITCRIFLSNFNDFGTPCPNQYLALKHKWDQQRHCDAAALCFELIQLQAPGMISSGKSFYDMSAGLGCMEEFTLKTALPHGTELDSSIITVLILIITLGSLQRVINALGYKNWNSFFSAEVQSLNMQTGS